MAKRSRPKTRSANEDCQNVIKMWVAPRSLMTKSVLCKRSNICRYREAGIVTIPDRNIAKKIIVLYDLYLAIKKKKSLTTKGATDQRASFKESLTALFDVSSDNAEDLIRADSSRSKKRKEEDLAFLHDQKTSRKQGMSFIDLRHIKVVKNREEREEKQESQAQKEKERLEKETGSGVIDMSTDSGGAGVDTSNTDKSMESLKEEIVAR